MQAVVLTLQCWSTPKVGRVWLVQGLICAGGGVKAGGSKQSIPGSGLAQGGGWDVDAAIRLHPNIHPWAAHCARTCTLYLAGADPSSP